MGLIEERGEGQPKHEGGRGDESPGEKEEPQQRSRQPEFPSWQVSVSSQTVPRDGGELARGGVVLAEGSRCREDEVGGMWTGSQGGQWGPCPALAAGACIENLIALTEP